MVTPDCQFLSYKGTQYRISGILVDIECGTQPEKAFRYVRPIKYEVQYCSSVPGSIPAVRAFAVEAQQLQQEVVGMRQQSLFSKRPSYR